MAWISFLNRVTSLPTTWTSGAADIELVRVGAQNILVAARPDSGGIAAWTTGTTPTLTSQVALSGTGLPAPATLTEWQTGGQSFVWVGGMGGAGASLFRVTETGQLVASGGIGTAAGTVTAIAPVTTATGSFVFTVARQTDQIMVWQQTAPGTFAAVETRRHTPEGTGFDQLALTTAQVGGSHWLLAASHSDHTLTSYRIDADGRLQVAARLGADGGLGIAGPAHVQIANFEGQTYAIVGATGTSSVSVVRIGTDGALTVTDQVNDTLDTRFQGVTALQVVEDAGRVYVIAAGSDDGLTVMTLLPGGRLAGLQTIAHQPGQDILNPAALTAEVIAPGIIRLYSADQGGNGFTGWTLNVASGGGVTQQAGAGGGALAGTAGDDVLTGGAGSDSINGGDGRDILIDGAGQDTLTGGAGADLFVFQPDGLLDRIQDFQLGVDRLDLSALTRNHSLEAIGFQSLSNGVRLTIGADQIQIVTANGQSLSRADFRTSDLFDLWHIDVGVTANSRILNGGAANDLLQGGVADDILTGSAGNDTLRGDMGDDVLNGGPGADLLDGGAGIDTADYTGSTDSLRVDLLFPHVNTNVATGDTYVSVENLIGSQGMDNLRGTHGDNLIQGMENVDFLYGRQGNDTLDGGIGDDVLFGGPGADLLIGGPGRDRAQYSESLTEVLVDLLDPSRNTGEATGDLYQGIENIAGSSFNDTVLGDLAANQLFGRDGNDHLYGRAGNDYLNGGANADRLDGGAGDDTLRGGTHNDTFVFNGGRDVIEDFTLGHADLIAIERAFFPVLAGRTAQQVVDDYARVTESTVVFDFGGSNTLTLLGTNTLTGLSDSLFLF